MKYKNLAYIGALLTTLTLGFDVFSQHIIGLGDRLVPDATAITNVPRSEFYSSGSTGTHTSWYKDPAMKASIKTAIMMENIPDLPVSYSTGNCTWPTIPTLAVCGACINVTASLSRTNDTWPNLYMCTLFRTGIPGLALVPISFVKSPLKCWTCLSPIRSIMRLTRT